MHNTEGKVTFDDMPKLIFELIEEVKYLNKLVQSLHTPLSQNQWMDIDQIRNYLPDHPARSTIYDWARHDKIPSHRNGKRYRFLKSEIDEWMENRG